MSASLPSSHPLRRASWIWPAYQQAPYNAYACFRRDFDLRAVPGEAPLHVTADQGYMLFVNGTYAGRGPARGFQHRWPFDTIDVAPLLRRGHNWISVLAHNPGVGTFQYLYGGRPGLLCAARWGEFELLSDALWQGCHSMAHRRYTAKLSKQLGFQEHFDARLDDRQWMRSPTPPDANWARPLVRLPFGSLPWHDVEPRGLPNLTGDVVDYQRVVSVASGPCQPDWPTWENPRDGWRAENAAAAWRPEPANSPACLEIPATGAGQFHSVLLDLGRVGVGSLLVRADGAEGGEVVDLFACEWLDADGRPRVPEDWTSLVTRLTLRPGTTRFDSMPLIGHRYLAVIVRGTTRRIQMKVRLRECIYPLDVQGRFTCGDARLNEIYSICINTQRVCALDSYVDTPWREQAQWWGDARVQAWNTFHLAPDARLLERGIRQIAAQRLPNGLTFGHAPTIAQDCVLPDFSLIWCLTLFDHYWQTGKARLFTEMWPEVLRLLGYFDAEGRGADGLLVHDARYWLFLDWTQINREGTPALLNLWYFHTLDKLAELARVTANAEALAALTSRRDAIGARIMERLYDRDRGLFHDGFRADGTRVQNYTVQCQTLAIMSGLAGESHERMVRDVLLPYLDGDVRAAGAPSAYWVTYVYGVLRHRGHDRAVLEHIRRHWAPMIPFGGCSEHFCIDPALGRPARDDGGSFSHAWSAHPLYHLMGTLGGVTQAAPGWTRVRFRPLLEMTDHCRVTTPTPLGPIRSGWERRGSDIAVSLELPAGVQADVRLPGIAAGPVDGCSHWSVGGK